MTQNKFAFFANFAETIRATIPAEKQPEAYQAICEFGIYGTLPDDPMLKMMCLMAKTSIYNKGGAPEGNQNAKKQPQKQPENNLKQPENNLKQPENNLKQPENNLKQPENNPISEIETETETETEIETETEKEGYSEKSPNKRYAFEGKIIKLKQKDFDEWQKAYPDLNLRGELLQRDIWLQQQPAAEQKRWFISTSQFFIKQNMRRKAQNAEYDEHYNTVTKPVNENECWF